MGPWNHTSLSEDAVPAGRDTDRSERWCHNSGKVGQKQTETHFGRKWRETCKGAKGSQVCGMFSSHTGEIFFFC